MTTEFTHHSALNDAINERFEATLQTLTDLVAIPSIAWESHDLTQVDRSAEAVAALARKAGFDNARIERATYTTADGTEKQGMPAVIAQRPAAEGYPTILLYAHHDVQPAGNLDLWNTEPSPPARATASTAAAQQTTKQASSYTSPRSQPSTKPSAMTSNSA